MIFLYPVIASIPHGAEVELWQTLIFCGILVAMIATLALEEKLHAKKSFITSAFAIMTLFLAGAWGILPTDHFSPMPFYIGAIDWEVITIILGSSLFVDATSKSGLFTWIAIRTTKASSGDPWRLLIFYGVMTVVFSAVLNNVTAMIIIGSLTGVSLRKLQRVDLLLGFLLVEGLLTNIGGLLTLISSVPNILIGNAAGISFFRFFLVASPYVLLATIATLWMGRKRFSIDSNSSKESRDRAKALVEAFDENDGVQSASLFWFSAASLVLFIGTLAATSVLPVVAELRMGYVALTFGFVALFHYKNSVDEYYRAIDWDLIFFFASLFIVIHVMEYAQVLALIGSGLESIVALGTSKGSATLLVTSAAFSALTDNIPLSAMLAKALQAMPEMAGDPDSPFWWSVVFGANLGGNLTPIGSASTVVAVTIMHRENLDVSFLRFVRLAAPFALVQIAIAVLYILFYSAIITQ
jgi:Na+/H+ antiporter NhaD/arsenite permease-like protein